MNISFGGGRARGMGDGETQFNPLHRLKTEGRLYVKTEKTSAVRKST